MNLTLQALVRSIEDDPTDEVIDGLLLELEELPWDDEVVAAADALSEQRAKTIRTMGASVMLV